MENDYVFATPCHTHRLAIKIENICSILDKQCEDTARSNAVLNLGKAHAGNFDAHPKQSDKTNDQNMNMMPKNLQKHDRPSAIKTNNPIIDNNTQ